MDLQCKENFSKLHVEEQVLSSTSCTDFNAAADTSYERRISASIDQLDASDDLLNNVGNFLRREHLYLPDPVYLHAIQTAGMTSYWRQQISNWIKDLAVDFKFGTGTIALAINYIDRYLSLHSANRKQLQLLALVSVFVASKFNETEQILMNEAIEIAGEAFSSQEIYQMEYELITALEWKLNAVTSYHFMEYLLMFMDIRIETGNESDLERKRIEKKHIHRLTCTLLQKIWSIYGFLEYLPSDIGLAACLTAFRLLNICTDDFVEYAFHLGFKMSKKVILCQQEITKLIATTTVDKLSAVRSPSPSCVFETSKIDEIIHVGRDIECDPNDLKAQHHPVLYCPQPKRQKNNASEEG